jgi:hypothetical protein
MSTTTNFKRIALVAVAALGLGVLSSVPSQAVINADSLTVSATTASQTTAETYTATSATATFSFLGATNDSVSLTASLVSGPSAAYPAIRVVETSSALVDSNTVAGARAVGYATAGNTAAAVYSTSAGAAVSTAKFAVYLSQGNDKTTAPTTAGTYVVKLTPAAIGVGPLVGATAQTITITVTTAAALSKNVSTSSTAYMVNYNSQDPAFAAQSADSSVVAVKTASQTPKATVFVTGVNPSGVTLGVTGESLTATITGAGTLSAQTAYNTAGTPLGRSILVRQTDYIQVYSDGSAGVGTLTIAGAVSGTLIATKTVSFSSDAATQFAAATIAATDSSVIAVAGTTKVSAIAKDAAGYAVSGLTGGTDYYAISSDVTVATVATYSYSATTGYGVIVTGVKAGTADIVFANASTLAAATFKSAPVTVRVGTNAPSSVKVTTDKTAYLPGEKITLTVTILDVTGKSVIGKTSYADIFSATGVTASLALQSGTLPGSAIADYSNVTNTKTYTLYAPVVPGTEVFSWTGGTALAAANQVAGSVSVTITDNASAALAAVTALATTVASLRTLIVTLTNLVLKIQKKVKA